MLQQPHARTGRASRSLTRGRAGMATVQCEGKDKRGNAGRRKKRRGRRAGRRRRDGRAKPKPSPRRMASQASALGMAKPSHPPGIVIHNGIYKAPHLCCDVLCVFCLFMYYCNLYRSGPKLSDAASLHPAAPCLHSGGGSGGRENLFFFWQTTTEASCPTNVRVGFI